MASSAARSSPARSSGAVIFPALMSFPVAAFTGAMITDITYARTAEFTWTTFSIWLLTAGLIVSGIAIAVGLIDALARGRWPTLTLRIGYAVALVLALVNAFVHSRDAYTTVVPTGLTLSIATVVVMFVTIGLNRRAVRAGAEPRL